MNGLIVIAAAGLLAVGAFYIGMNYDEEPNSGPAQELGEKIDETLNDAARKLEDATD